MTATLKVLFWNVWCLPKPFTDGKYYSDERAKLIAPLLIGYDLVLLCEAWTKCAKKVFLKTYPYQYTDNGVCGKIFGTGLMILSKYPILNPDKIIYNNSSDWDWFAGKGAFHFQLQINQKTFDFFFTHMQATYSNYSEASQTARLYQSLQLSKFVNDKLKSNNSNDIFMIGDFNMWSFYDNPNLSPNDSDDNILRSASYEMIKSQTNMTDVQTIGGDVYRFFTRRTDNKTTLTYMSSQGYSDGPYVIIEFPI